MDRKMFQKKFTGLDEYLLSSICDDIELCENIDYPVYTKYFMPPILSYSLKDLRIGNIKFKLCGISKNCEKNMIAIYPEEFEDIIDFPVKYFRIENKSKFKDLQHKDYLGSIMNLGKRREILGDLIVEGKFCYGITTEENFEFLKGNLSLVGRNPVEIEEVRSSEIPESKFEEIVVTVPSLRVDSLVAEIVGTSRAKAVTMIENQDVNLNYSIETNRSKILKLEDTITIRKKGKFIVLDVLGETKKGKIRIALKKFI